MNLVHKVATVGNWGNRTINVGKLKARHAWTMMPEVVGAFDDLSPTAIGQTGCFTHDEVNARETS
jgi:hypothetical protein